jgi:arylformamidase
MAKYIWLSYPLDILGPRPPAIPEPKLKTLYTIDKDGASVQILEVASHTGTHVDAPQHVVKDSLSIHDFKPEELIFTSPVIIDLPLKDAEIVMEHHLKLFEAKIKNTDIVLFRFGYGAVRKSDPKRFSLKSPGFGVESAQYIRKTFPRLRAMGIDVPSLACINDLDNTMRSHNILLEGKGRRFLVIEEMMIPPDLQKLKEVRVNPWLVKGMDSAPCTVVGVV